MRKCEYCDETRINLHRLNDGVMVCCRCAADYHDLECEHGVDDLITEENSLEESGHLAGDDRRTCYTHKGLFEDCKGHPFHKPLAGFSWVRLDVV